MRVPSHALNEILVRQGRRPKRTLVIAHRGASVDAPENTLAALAAAIECGADGVEFDVRGTLDDDLVLMHDETVNRTTDGRGYVIEKMLPQIKTLDAGRWFGPNFRREPVPTLAQALKFVRRRIVPIIELKDSFENVPWAADRVAKILEESGLEQDAVVIARDLAHLRRLRKTSPMTPVGAVTLGARESLNAFCEDLDGCFAFWFSTSPRIAAAARKTRSFLAAWTLDSSHARNVAGYGVDAIVTNDPCKTLKILGA